VKGNIGGYSVQLISRRRTKLFTCSIFKFGDKAKGFCDNFGYKWSHFKPRILYSLRHEVIHMLGHRFESIEYEGNLLYSMAGNSELFGTARFRYNEKQFYKKF
jgi:hypothetical protein